MILSDFDLIRSINRMTINLLWKSNIIYFKSQFQKGGLNYSNFTRIKATRKKYKI